MNVLGSIRKDGGACAKPSEPRSTQAPIGQTPMPLLQGMSAEQEAEILVDSLSSTDHIVVTREQYEYLVSAIAIGFTNREATARADERKIVQHEYSATDLTVAIQERMEFRDQRDALIAAKSGERVKAWNEAVKKYRRQIEGRAMLISVNVSPEAHIKRGIFTQCKEMADTLLLLEASPVEPSKGEGT